MKISKTGLAIVKAFEGCLAPVKGRPGYFKAYRDPVGVLTIGYGHTNHHEPKFDEDTVWSQAACDAALAGDMATFERHVSKQARVPLKQYEFDALVSWAFNTGGPSTASLWGSLNRGNRADVPRRLMMWNKAGGRELPGLTRRRKSEAALFRGDIAGALRIAGVKGDPSDFEPPETPQEPMPQRIDPPADEPEAKPEKKPGLIRRILAFVSGISGLGFLAYLTDWEVAVVVAAFALISIWGAIAFVIWLFGKEQVRAWLRREVSE